MKALLTLLLVFTLCETRGDVAQLPDQISLLAHKGDVAAQLQLGLRYRHGNGRESDHKTALEWLNKAAAAGDPIASDAVGSYYAGRPSGVVTPNPKKALELKTVAAAAGLAHAQHEVAMQSLLKKNFSEAMGYLEKAAKQGFAPAMQALSFCYHEGKAKTKDPVLSFAYLELARVQFDRQQREWLDKLAKQREQSLSAAQRTAAREFVARFKAAPTPLTLKAQSLLEPKRSLAGSKQ